MTHYPMRVSARLDAPLSRWLWLVKWLLVIPHYIILWFLWVAFAVLTVVAFFAILFTGRYPRSIFDFNVGVLRWSWRVAYYSYAALGTDRYPPFTLAEVPDYPARLSVEYPERLSRGLVLVKWWLLAIPHFLIVAVFLGGGYALTRDENALVAQAGGLLGLLVLFAGVALLFTGRYPGGLFDFVLGVNRWVLRLVAYVGLMTDDYPPLRLDGGADEPTGPSQVPPTAPTASTASPVAVPAAAVPRSGAWTAGRVVSVIVGALLLVTGVGAATAGAATAWFDQAGRDDAGYLSTPAERVTTTGYALRYERIQIGAQDWAANDLDWLGTVRVQASGSAERTVFVGIARTGDVDRYLGTVSSRTGMPGQRGWQDVDRPVAAPTDQTFWVAASSGTGEQALTWDATTGDWTLVVMNADADAGVDVDVRVGATLPGLRGVWTGLFVGAGIALLAGTLMITLAVTAGNRPVPAT